jgi:hypothetical protein
MAGYCVSVDREARYIKRPPSVAEVEEYIIENLDLLRHAGDRQYYLGGWFNVKEDAYYLDVTLVELDLDVAREVGNRHKQKALWDVRNEREIWL